MDMMPGFKQADMGLIPDEWEVVVAAKICELVVDCKNRTPPVVNGGDYAVVRTPNVRNGKFVREELRFTDAESFRIWTARAIPQIGDVLITREAPLGEVCLVPADIRVCLGQRMMLYRPDQTKADSHFLLYALTSRGVRNNLLKMIGGSTVGHAKVDDIRNLSVPLPPTKAEQEAIAEALRDTDALIESLEQVLAKKCLIKQGGMQELLTGKRRLPGFSEKWEVRSLGDVVDIKKGELITAETAVAGPIPVIAGGMKPTYFHDRANRLGKNITISGSGASAGYVAFHETPIFASDCSTIGEGPKYEIAFIYFALVLIQAAIFRSQTGGAQPHIHPSDLRPLTVSIPPSKAEQTAIANVLSEMDAEIAALEAKLTKARSLKQGIMQDLLTGRIRLL